MVGFNDTISNVYSFPFTANSLLTFDLVHIIPQQQNVQRVNTKPEHSCFVNFVPGEGQGGSRTYNFKNKITLKYSLQEIEGLHFVLKNNAETNGQAVNPYRKFSNSQQGGSKSVSVWQGSQQKQVAGKDISVRTIFIQAQAGQNKVSLSMSPEQAYAVASSLHEMFLTGNSLEIERMIKAPRISSGSNNNNSYQSQNNNNQNGGFIAQEPEPQQEQSLMSSEIASAANRFSGMINDNPF
ncbi:MAG: hypothetical protein H8D97_01855 [Proteobacteria bacterium]|nr:hypothetical protein [Pseudomonadota bacterium]